MPDPPEGSRRPRAGAPASPPSYKKYRSAPRFFRHREAGVSPLDELREGLRDGAAPGGVAVAEDGRDPDGGGVAAPARPRRRFALPRNPRPYLRALRWLVTLGVAWLVLSLVLFLISAQIRQGDLSGDVDLAGAGYPLTSANTVLVLGSDQRSASTKEPGASTSGPSRSDSILLMRIGGGKSARLSIPRDTVVDIPGRGRDKINAAYAYGGPALAVQTIEQFTGLEINHLIEIDFANFPDLIDAMGGIDYTGGCVISKINGGYANGGVTLRLKKGASHLDGEQALALARTRHNLCNPRESDLTRARRQQKLLAAMKSRVVSVNGFLRLPWISWNVPKALRSDMGGPTLLGLFGAMATSGSPATRVLEPTGVETTPGGGAGLTVTDAEVRTEARRFLQG